MQYVIAGGAGFIGSHLAEKLIQHGEQVIVIDNESTGRAENLQSIHLSPLFKYVVSDLQKVTDWEQILGKETVIIHLAATVGVNKVVENALETLENNYTSTILLLKLALRFHCKLFFASTSEVYGNGGKPFSKETDTLVINGTNCGRSSYIISKLISEQYCMQYFQEYGLQVMVGRFFNVIGTRQVSTYGMVTPSFIEQAIKNAPITVYGDGSQTRNFCDVDDVTTAIIRLLETEAAYGNIFNIGGNQNTTILELAQYIKDATHSNSSIIFLPHPWERSNGRDIEYRSPSLEKIKTFTNWRPIIQWRDSVQTIINDMQLHQSATVTDAILV